MAGKKAQTKPATPASAPKPVGSTVRDVGIDVPIPEKPCTDPKCPFHGRLSVRGQTLEGVFVSTRMQNTVVIERQYLRFIRKYQRYEKRTRRMNVHAPPCLGLQIGHRVLAMEFRPLGKTVHFVAIHNQGLAGWRDFRDDRPPRRCIRNGSWHRPISRRRFTTSRRLTSRGPSRSEKATRSASCEAASAARKERSSRSIASMGPSSSKGSRSRRWMRRKWPGRCTPRISSSSAWTTRIHGAGANSRSESTVKKHLKRLPAPRSWTIPRKTDFWVVKPSAGPHPIDASVPLGLILRDMLKVCASAREARHILNDRGVLVDGRAVTDPKFPVGLMDVLSFATTKAHYRMLVDTRGKMALVPIGEADSNWKLCRVEDKTTVRRGKTQVNLHDGRNVLLEKDAYKTGATLKVHVPDQKVVEHYELGKGAPVLVTGGQHVGEIAHVLDIQRTRNPRANIVTFTEGFSTDIGKVFVVGKEAPSIKTPEVSAL